MTPRDLATFALACGEVARFLCRGRHGVMFYAEMLWVSYPQSATEMATQVSR